METHNDDQEGRTLHLTILEKSVVGLFSSLALILLVWVGVSVSEMSIRVAVIESQLTNMEDVMGDRYTGTQARQHEREMERRVNRLESAHGLN